MPRHSPLDPENLHALTRDEELQLWAIVESGTKIGKKYFRHGEEIGEAVRGRMVEAVVRNARVRGHMTNIKEIHTILQRCYADEIRYRFGQKTKKRLDGTHAEINDETAQDVRFASDGGLDDAFVRVYLEHEANALAVELKGRRGGVHAYSRVASTMSHLTGTETMQEIADAANVSKTSVLRACSLMYERLEDGS